MRLYIAGPMTGHDNHNFPAFDHARDALAAAGHDVVSPADLCRAAGFDPRQTVTRDQLVRFMLRDLDAIATCDGIALLHGWEHSRGVAVELAYANYIGLTTIQTWRYYL